MAEHLRISVLGKTGSGKSSLGNTILGERLFEIDHTANSATSACKKETRVVNGTTITLIDTPGFFDTHQSEEEMKAEVVKCVIECSSGLHAFLILLKVEKYTEHEKEVITRIKESFSEEAFRYAVLVFTYGDQLPEGTKIEDFSRGNKSLHELLEKCGRRCHVFDNKYWNNNPQNEYRNNQRQTENLLNTINEMVVNNRGCYTNEMLREVEKLIQQEEERIIASSGNMSQEEVREQAKNKIYNILKTAAGITTGVLLGALLGVVTMTGIVVNILQSVGIQAAIAATTTTKVGAAAGAIVGGGVGYYAAEKADSVREAVENTAKDIGELAMNTVTAVSNTVREIEASRLKK